MGVLWRSHFRGEVPVNMHQTLPFVRNEHGHHVLEVEGVDWTGQEELARPELMVRGSARELLSMPDYDLKHYLKRRIYRVALIHWSELSDRPFAERTSANYLAHGLGFGYQQSRAGLQPRLHDLLAGQLMGQGYYCAALHEPILVESQLTLLYSRQYPDGWTLTTDSGNPSHEWHDPGWFALEIPE
mgnify:CR=1 FL=1